MKCDHANLTTRVCPLCGTYPKPGERQECMDVYMACYIDECPSAGYSTVGGGDEKGMLVEPVPIGNHLTAKFVQENRITAITITNEGEYVKFEQNGKEVEKISLGIEFNGRRSDDPATWTLNNKSRNALITIFGKDTADWIGKTVELKIEGMGEYTHITVDTLRTKNE